MIKNSVKLPTIKVVGIGGGGGNAVNRMVGTKVDGAEFLVMNTDERALEVSLSEQKIQLGPKLTEGAGAGAVPDVGRKAAEESIDIIKKTLRGTGMLFITAGMGGGTGTGASPVVAKIAKELGILTIGIVTKPFMFEGTVRKRHAEEGVEALREQVDALIVISNDKLLDMVDESMSVIESFKIVDDVLRQSVQGITEIVTKTGLIDLDFSDIRTIMENSGTAIIGIGRGSGKDRVEEAAKAAISSPLLEETVERASKVMLNVAGSQNLTLHEINNVAKAIYKYADKDANVVFGSVIDESLGDEIVVTVIATTFKQSEEKLEIDDLTEINEYKMEYKEAIEKDIDEVNSDFFRPSKIESNADINNVTVEIPLMDLNGGVVKDQKVKKSEFIQDSKINIGIDIPAFLRSSLGEDSHELDEFH